MITPSTNAKRRTARAVRPPIRPEFEVESCARSAAGEEEVDGPAAVGEDVMVDKVVDKVVEVAVVIVEGVEWPRL